MVNLNNNLEMSKIIMSNAAQKSERTLWIQFVALCFYLFVFGFIHILNTFCVNDCSLISKYTKAKLCKNTVPCNAVSACWKFLDTFNMSQDAGMKKQLSGIRCKATYSCSFLKVLIKINLSLNCFIKAALVQQL